VVGEQTYVSLRPSPSCAGVSIECKWLCEGMLQAKWVLVCLGPYIYGTYI